MNNKAKASTIPGFKKAIWAYYKQNGRKFPWRETTDPYHIIVSEVMLQQTQTHRVVEKYLAFIKEFPTFNALAGAPVGAVLTQWQGLGYNRRALALKKAAEIIVKEHGGCLPRTLEALDALPGIGEATAASISAFAFNIPHPFIETNIRRVFIHFFFPKAPRVSDTRLFPLIKETLDHKNPREWYYALMDYGAMLPKTIKNPNHKSLSYTKQSAFKGSNREVRGAILRFMTTKKKATSLDLVNSLSNKFDRAKIERNIEELIAEGFFVYKNNIISL